MRSWVSEPMLLSSSNGLRGWPPFMQLSIRLGGKLRLEWRTGACMSVGLSPQSILKRVTRGFVARMFRVSRSNCGVDGGFSRRSLQADSDSEYERLD